MKIFKWIARVACTLMAVVSFTGCQLRRETPAEVQRLYVSEMVVDRARGAVYFGVGDTLYRWAEDEGDTEIVAEDFFYKNEQRQMVVLDGKVYTVRWNSGILTALNPETGEKTELAQVFNWEESNYCGYIWTYNRKICNLYQPHSSAQAEVQIRNTKGDLIDSLPLPVKYAYPLFVYNQYLFYQDTNAFGPSHIVNLDNGEDYLLGIYKPIDLIDDHLLVRQQAVWDENGAYQWTGTQDYFLLDKDGNVFPTSVNSNLYAIDDKCCYYGTVNTLYSIMNGKDHDLLRFDKYLPDDYMIDNGVLYMQFRSNCRILSETIQMVDATGENAEAVAEANETRIFLSGGDTLTLALTPDGTLYLLNRS